MRARALKDFHKLRSTVFGIGRSLGRKTHLDYRNLGPKNKKDKNKIKIFIDFLENKLFLIEWKIY